MGAFEFDSKADLSARSCNFCGNGSNERGNLYHCAEDFRPVPHPEMLGQQYSGPRSCRKERNPQLQRYALRG